jgi:hypothetical protein
MKMTDLPPSILHFFAIFSQMFSFPVYKNALLLFKGHVLCKGRRTVADILRHLNLSKIKNYSKFHWVLNGAKWKTVEGAKILLIALCKICQREIVISIDSTVERRKGDKIKGLGRQRDGARSTKMNKVLTIGLNWLVCAIHVKYPWTDHVWACPFFSLIMPPERPLSSSKNKTDLNIKRRHKTLNQWASQCVRLISKWIGHLKEITIVADGAFATYLLANTCIDNNVNLISRMRLDARTFDYPKKSTRGRGRPCLVGSRLPTFDKIAKDPSQMWSEVNVKWYGNTRRTLSVLSGTCLWYGYGIRPVPIKWVLIKNGNQISVLFSTNLKHNIEYIIESFVQRWQLEVTFEESRRHLGIETQRQWSDQAIDRTTPCIFASFSMICLIAFQLTKEKNEEITIQQASWYKKSTVTFSDVINYLRSDILKHQYFSQFGKKREPKKSPFKEVIDLLAAA